MYIYTVATYILIHSRNNHFAESLSKISTEMEAYTNKTGDTFTGRVIVSSKQSASIAESTYATSQFEINSGPDASSQPIMTFRRTGSYGVNIGLDADNKFKIGGYSMGAKSYEFWHSGNIPIETKGIWTPRLRGYSGGGSPTYTVQKGEYVRDGNLISLKGSIAISDKGGMVGAIQIYGLPFGISHPVGAFPGMITGINITSPYFLHHAHGHDSWITFKKASNTGVTNLLDTDINSDFTVVDFSCNYFID